MIVCPWCGTNYTSFQSNCSNCGAPLQAADEKSAFSEDPPAPPPAPRAISDRYAWRLLSSDGWAITAFVFGILGLVFSLVGASLTIAVITAFIGLPFLLLGLAFLVAAGSLFVWRYQNAKKMVTVLREGQVSRGKIIDIQPNYAVRVNGRNPWTIRYQFQANGQGQEGTVSTLNQPGPQFQAGKDVYVLYLPSAPKWNSIYPHP